MADKVDLRAIEGQAGLSIYARSVSEAGGIAYFLARRGTDKFVGMLGQGAVAGEKAGSVAGQPLIVGPTSHENAEVIRAALPWTAPRLVGLRASIGLGDRLGLATPGHIRAVRGSGLACVLAQQSIREMTRTARTPQQVMDCATWGVLQEGFREGFGSDADHLQTVKDVDTTLPAGFTMFTFDPGAQVDDSADALEVPALAWRYERLDFAALETTAGELRRRFVGRKFPLSPHGSVEFDEVAFLRAVVKYGRAVAHAVRMFRHLAGKARRGFELEVSVDETANPTSAAEHYFIAAELRRLGVQWVSLAPRLVGRFEKGVDYIGDLCLFRDALSEHVAVMRTLGPYKLSVHSGSDKLSVYPILAELTDGMVHVKTAGTSYLCALRAIAQIDPALFREVLEFARSRYEADRATYCVSADVARVPSASEVADEDLPVLLDDFHVREVLHVTFGSVLTAQGGALFASRITQRLREHEETHYAFLEAHLGRHVELLRKA